MDNDSQSDRASGYGEGLGHDDFELIGRLYFFLTRELQAQNGTSAEQDSGLDLTKDVPATATIPDTRVGHSPTAQPHGSFPTRELRPWGVASLSDRIEKNRRDTRKLLGLDAKPARIMKITENERTLGIDDDLLRLLREGAEFSRIRDQLTVASAQESPSSMAAISIAAMSVLREIAQSSRPGAGDLEMNSPSVSAQPSGGSDLGEAERLQFLDNAMSQRASPANPLQELAENVRAAAIDALGGQALLGRPIRSDEDLVAALVAGFPGLVLRKLQDAGFSHAILEHVIAPRRTLMRRRADGQRLTPEESDAAWRLAHALMLADAVLNGRAAALDWLTRTKDGTGLAPFELLKTSVGAAAVERKLWQLEWGDVA